MYPYMGLLYRVKPFFISWFSQEQIMLQPITRYFFNP